jgi:hypothetical protein
MALASLGALIAMSATAFLNFRSRRDFAAECNESLRVKSAAPLNENARPAAKKPKRLITVRSMIMLAAAAAACDSADPIADVRRDVATAEAARSNNVAEARSDGAQTIQQERQDVSAERDDVRNARATRNYEVVVAKAEGDYEIAAEACDALSGNAQVDCKDQAEAALKSDKTRAELLNPKV